MKPRSVGVQSNTTRFKQIQMTHWVLAAECHAVRVRILSVISAEERVPKPPPEPWRTIDFANFLGCCLIDLIERWASAAQPLQGRGFIVMTWAIQETSASPMLKSPFVGICVRDVFSLGYLSHIISEWYIRDIPRIFPCYSHAIPLISPWFYHDFTMIFPYP